MSETNKPTTVFWVVAILAVVWYILGVGAYLGNVFATEEAIAAMPQADQDYMANVPAWSTAAFATCTRKSPKPTRSYSQRPT